MTGDPYFAGVRRWNLARWALPVAVFLVLFVISVKVGAWRGELIRDGALRFGMFVIPVIVFLALMAAQDLWKARVSRGWPTQPATVLSCRKWTDWGAYGFRDRVEVQLAFASGVPPSPYTYSEITMWPLGNFDELLRTYSPGASVSVPYNPENASIVVLDATGQQAKHELALALAALTVCVGMTFLPGNL